MLSINIIKPFNHFTFFYASNLDYSNKVLSFQQRIHIYEVRLSHHKYLRLKNTFTNYIHLMIQQNLYLKPK